MRCPECPNELTSQSHKGINLLTCSSCQGMFIVQEELRQIEEKKDPALGWLDLELWRHKEQYEAFPDPMHCPSCAAHFHTISYPKSQVKIQVCHACRAVWISESMLSALHNHLEQRIATETVSEYLKDFGHEIMEVLGGKEKVKNLGIILKLLQYRIFSELPFIRNLIQNLPKV